MLLLKSHLGSFASNCKKVANLLFGSTQPPTLSRKWAV